MINNKREEVLRIGKLLLDATEFNKFEREYNKVEKFIFRLNTDTQVDMILKFISEDD